MKFLRTQNQFLACLVVGLSVSCAQKKFEAANNVKNKPAAAPADENSNADMQQSSPSVQSTSSSVQTVVQSSSNSIANAIGSKGVVFGSGISDDDKNAMKKCLDLWGNHPFKTVDGNANPSNFKKMKTSVAVAGIQIGKVDDSIATNHDVLVVIDPAVNLVSNVEYKLLNPKGWYCMKFQVTAGAEQTKATTNVKLHCDAKLAKSNLVIGVDSTANTGVVGVNNTTVGVGSVNKPGTVAQGNIVIDGTVSLNRVSSSGNACAK
jgi:hypothetical protein